MNPEQQHVAIAELCGWRRHEQGYWVSAADGIRICDEHGGDAHPPDYLSDLNACHEMEKALRPSDWPSYRQELASVMQRDVGEPNVFWIFHATAAQRCEAFLNRSTNGRMAK